MKTLAALLLAALPLFAHAQYGATYTQRPAGGGCTAGSACTGTTITATTALSLGSGADAFVVRSASGTFDFGSTSGAKDGELRAGTVSLFNGSNRTGLLQASGWRMASDGSVTWTSNTTEANTTRDLYLTRSAAAILAITGDGTGTASGQTGWYAGNLTTTTSALWSSTVTRSASNYSLAVSNTGDTTQLNAVNTVVISTGGTTKVTQSGTAGAGAAITAGTAATASMFATSWTQTRNYSAAATDYLSATFTTTGGGTATHASDNLLNLKTGASGAEASVFKVGLDGTVTLANASFRGTAVTVNADREFAWLSSTYVSAPSNGALLVRNSAGNKNVELRAIVPVIGACGTSPSVAGTDTAMTVTVGTTMGTTCAVTFSSAFTNAPACTVISNTDILPLIMTTSTTALTVTKTIAFTDSSKLHIHCIGYV